MMGSYVDAPRVGGFGSGLGLDLLKSNIDVSDDALLAKRKKDFIDFVNDISVGITIESYSYPMFLMEAFNLFFKTDKKTATTENK